MRFLRATPARRALLVLALALLVLLPFASAEAARGFQEAWLPYLVFVFLTALAAMLAWRGPRLVAAGLGGLLAVAGALVFFFAPYVAAAPLLVLVAASMEREPGPAHQGMSA